MTNEEKDQLLKVLSEKCDEIRVNEAEIRDSLQKYETLKKAFIQLLEEHKELLERRDVGNPNEVEYKYMELSGLLEI